MTGTSAVQPGEDINVDIEAQPADVISDKNSQYVQSSQEPPPSWPKINQDGKPGAPDEGFQKNYYTDKFSPGREGNKKACDLQSIDAFNRLANLSIAYYHHDLERMDKVLAQNGGVMDDAQLCHMRQTLQEYYAAVQNAREIDRTMNEKREYDSLFADQNIDRAVKVMTYIVFILIAPIICVVSVLSLRLRRQTELWDVADIFFGLEAYGSLAEFIARVLIAITGGMTLLTPMIILSLLDPPMPHRVLTVCLCVVGFSIAAMVIFRPRTTDLLGIVGAYTAVLVVYVGSS